ncbi:hypothetical protein AYO22_06913 [Fonsecaea multimorphosa]|nr:hypothetical protein AYO22_06913 [Fonsecaea multimorphosa]
MNGIERTEDSPVLGAKETSPKLYTYSLAHLHLNANITHQLEPSEAPSTYDFDFDRPPSLPLPAEPPSSLPAGLHDHTGLQNHNPWSEDTNDDDGPSFTTFEFTATGGSGRMVLSTRSWRTDGRNVRTDDLYEALDEMGQLLTRLDELQNRDMPVPFGPLDPFGFPRGQGVMGRHDPPLHLQPAGLQDLFSLILQSMQPEGLRGPDAEDRQRGGQPPLPFDLLQQMLNPANARSGDMVFSQEAFDRVMTQLMEQHNGSTAPPPASEEAILSLKKKQVDREMLGEEGKAECSICMDNVELGNEVTVLPCNHWFHGDCKIASGRDLHDGDTVGEHLQYQVRVLMALKAVVTPQHRSQRVPARYEKLGSHIMEDHKSTTWNAQKPIAIQAFRVT